MKTRLVVLGTIAGYICIALLWMYITFYVMVAP